MLVDAADMGLPSGSVRVLPPEKITARSFSTHTMPLSAFVSYVRELCGQGFIIGIQPERAAIGNALSDVTQTSADRIVAMILEEGLGKIEVLG